MKKEKFVELHTRIEARHKRYIVSQMKKQKVLSQGEMVRIILDHNMFHNGAK